MSSQMLVAISSDSDFSLSYQQLCIDHMVILIYLIDCYLDKDNDEMMIEHNEEADAALSALIQLKQDQRKKGILQAMRTQYLIRTRALDIFEIIYQKLDISKGKNLIVCVGGGIQFRPSGSCMYAPTHRYDIM